MLLYYKKHLIKTYDACVTADLALFFNQKVGVFLISPRKYVVCIKALLKSIHIFVEK